MPLWDTVTDLAKGAETLRRRRFGVIEVAQGQFRRIVLRPVPKLISAPEILLFGGWHHARTAGDRIRLYYNQPWRSPNFLVLAYALSSRHTTYRSLCRALAVLDEIARLKAADALLCDVGNWRVSTEILARWSWEPHCPSRWHRHYIKRLAPSAAELRESSECRWRQVIEKDLQPSALQAGSIAAPGA